MPRFAVRFKGMLTKDERARLSAAGIDIEGSKSSMVAETPDGGTVGIGRPIYTVTLETASADEALAKVREAIEPDTGNFTGWEVDPG